MIEKLDCHQVSRLLSDGLDAELPAATRARLRLHLVLCDACREIEQQMRFIRKALRRAEPDAPPDERGRDD